MRFFYHFGNYLTVLQRVFRKPESGSLFREAFVRSCWDIGIGSVGIVAIVSLFTGMVTTVQTAYQLVAAYIPKSTIGAIVSDSSILELSPTIMTLVLAGKIGSNIASEIGTMKVSEQIDALEVMGVNSASFLILPKICAALIMIPLLVITSELLCVAGGMIVGDITGILTTDEFIQGARSTFAPFTFYFSMIKAFTYSFFIASVASYQGYIIQGGAREVGEASTKAVVYCCVIILLSDYVLAQLLL
jgi:phospholipid/cholesterol/gamma-HCH transport system permease protein